jgi:glutamate/aspartate transport system ATP-binding protein
VNGLEPFQQGEVTVDGISVGDAKTNLPKLRARVGMVFQHFELFPHLSVVDNLTIAQIKVLGRSKDDARQRGLKMLDRVGLSAHRDKFPGQLSGGQQQRVAIARALVNNPRLILADEPTGALDSQTSEDIMLLLAELNAQGMTVVLVTHEADIAAWARRRLVFRDGRVLEDVVQQPYRPAAAA